MAMCSSLGVPLVLCWTSKQIGGRSRRFVLHFYDQNCKCAASCTVRAPFVVLLICWSPEPKV
jgi:hypothetical protein